jgi:hypothetical protein
MPKDNLIERLLASADGFAKFAQEVSMADLLREAASPNP